MVLENIMVRFFHHKHVRKMPQEMLCMKSAFSWFSESQTIKKHEMTNTVITVPGWRCPVERDSAGMFHSSILQHAKGGIRKYTCSISCFSCDLHLLYIVNCTLLNALISHITSMQVPFNMP